MLLKVIKNIGVWVKQVNEIIEFLDKNKRIQLIKVVNKLKY